jgi:hypothetical protein
MLQAVQEMVLPFSKKEKKEREIRNAEEDETFIHSVECRFPF